VLLVSILLLIVGVSSRDRYLFSHSSHLRQDGHYNSFQATKYFHNKIVLLKLEPHEATSSCQDRSTSQRRRIEKCPPTFGPHFREQRAEKNTYHDCAPFRASSVQSLLYAAPIGEQLVLAQYEFQQEGRRRCGHLES
jgi:hypothetical protein